MRNLFLGSLSLLLFAPACGSSSGDDTPAPPEQADQNAHQEMAVAVESGLELGEMRARGLTGNFSSLCQFGSR